MDKVVSKKQQLARNDAPVETVFKHQGDQPKSLIFRGETFHLDEGELRVIDATPEETQELLDEGFRIVSDAGVESK